MTGHGWWSIFVQRITEYSDELLLLCTGFAVSQCSIFVRIAVKSGLNSQHTTREIIFENGPTAGLPGFPMGSVGLIGNGKCVEKQQVEGALGEQVAVNQMSQLDKQAQSTKIGGNPPSAWVRWTCQSPRRDQLSNQIHGINAINFSL